MKYITFRGLLTLGEYYNTKNNRYRLHIITTYVYYSIKAVEGQEVSDILCFAQSDIMPCGIVIFLLCKSDIIFATKLPVGQYHSALAEYHCAAI